MTRSDKPSIGSYPRSSASHGKIKWYGHAPEGVMENDQVKVLWDFMVQKEIITLNTIDPTLYSLGGGGENV